MLIRSLLTLSILLSSTLGSVCMMSGSFMNPAEMMSMASDTDQQCDHCSHAVSELHIPQSSGCDGHCISQGADAFVSLSNVQIPQVSGRVAAADQSGLFLADTESPITTQLDQHWIAVAERNPVRLL